MPPHLSPSDLALLAQLIREHHYALAVQLFGADALSPEQVQAAIDAGALTPDQMAAAGDRGTLGRSYVFGSALFRAPEAARDSSAFEAEVPALTERLSPWERRMAQVARQRGASMIVGLGNTVADDLTTLVIDSDNHQARRLRQVIAEKTADAIEEAKSWTQLRGELGEALGEDWARDVGRIAATEMQIAVNAGYADAIEADVGHNALVAVIPQPDACPTCLRWYLEPDGKPRIYALASLPPPTVNFKVKTAEKVPTRPPAHPWCHCQLVYVEPGWYFDDDWTLVPSGALGDKFQKAATPARLGAAFVVDSMRAAWREAGAQLHHLEGHR